MEYEIGDDPQGLPDRPEGYRDGGLRESPFFRKPPPRPRPAPNEADAPIEQPGELA